MPPQGMPAERYAVMTRFGAFFAGFHEAVRHELEGMTDEELRQLEQDFGTLNTTNCWFATYEARQTVLHEIRVVLDARSARRTRRSW